MGATPILIAAQEGHIQIVKLLAAKQRVDLNQPAHNGGTPVYLAAQNGHIEIVKFLAADERVDLNKSMNGQTPIAIAAYGGYTEIVNILAAKQIQKMKIQFSIFLYYCLIRYSLERIQSFKQKNSTKYALNHLSKLLNI